MKRKQFYKPGVLESGVLPKYDSCQTPQYALDPLFYSLCGFDLIWEPAVGEGNIANRLREWGFVVLQGDVITGQDFFEYHGKQVPLFDAIVTNPPYSLKYDWIEHCYELGKPWALLLPVETLGSSRAQKMFNHNGIEVMFLDKRINFDMPNKHYEGAAQFPTAWFTWKILPNQINFGHIVRW